MFTRTFLYFNCAGFMKLILSAFCVSEECSNELFNDKPAKPFIKIEIDVTVVDSSSAIDSKVDDLDSAVTTIRVRCFFLSFSLFDVFCE